MKLCRLYEHFETDAPHVVCIEAFVRGLVVRVRETMCAGSCDVSDGEVRARPLRQSECRLKSLLIPRTLTIDLAAQVGVQTFLKLCRSPLMSNLFSFTSREKVLKRILARVLHLSGE